MQIEPPYFQMRAYILIGRNQLYNDEQVFFVNQKLRESIDKSKRVQKLQRPCHQRRAICSRERYRAHREILRPVCESVPHYYSNNKSSA